MLGGIFHKRKKGHELRAPSLQDLKKFRDAYAKYAELRQVETPPCFEKSIYKAIAGQKELHSVEFRQEDITDPQMIALAEALLEMPMISSLDLRDNRITDDGAKALLEVLRLQIIAAKTPSTIDQRTKQPLYPPLPEYRRYVTNVNLKGNEVSPAVLQELSQYMDVLRREDKRLEIRAALTRIDRNRDGSIDEDEFKGVLKLLTASTPTKKEIRAFMQQHTLSTDSAQNVINLENVLLAKCATSPSRHSACPPWEALVQERHALLGAPRMAATVMSSLPEPSSGSSSKARLNRPSLPSSGSGLGANPFIHSNSAPDVSPLSSPVSQFAPVAPVDMTNAAPKPPPAPTVNASVTSQPLQYVTKLDSKTPALPPDHSTTFTRPPAIPILPLASVIQHPVSPSPRSARSSADDEGQRISALSREGGPSSVISAPASPHDSDISDSMSVVSSTFGGSVSLRGMQEEQEHTNVPERKPIVSSVANGAPTALDSPRWQSEHFSGEDDEGASTGALSGAHQEADELSSGDADDDARSGYSHRTAKSVVASGSSSDHKSVANLSHHDTSFPGNEAPREMLTRGSEYSSTGHEEKRSLPGSVVSTPRFEDLSSLVYRGSEEGGRAALASTLDKVDSPAGQPEEDEEVEERVDSLVFDLMKDGKERYVMRLVHSEFRSGLSVKDFPAELPFRNLLALLLADNGLSDLALFAECRFPFVTVLDLSRNKLAKLTDDGLVAFPRLEVLNLADNHLKSIAGLASTFKLRALGLSGNGIRTVKNVEHLVQLEILQLADNQIATVHALRLLSLNKVLAHLDIDGNPVVETDERQKRKNIVHVRNLLPSLQSLGSIPCAGLHSKDKKKLNTSTGPGKCLFESDLLPDYKALWVSTACDTLDILRDAAVQSSARSQDDDDEWDTRDEDADRPKKPLTREQQRQKDELRSRAIGFRSRGKAIPSPPKVKTSAYCFGPPQPPSKKKKKKPVHADPSVIREQQRRASELSAPKHAPVDKSLMHQEQKRKSRVDFHGAMTVGERLQLARDMTQRRPTATIGLSARSRSILAKADSRKRASTASSKTEKGTGPESDPTATSRPPSPQRPSPMKDAMVFRIDPADTPRSPKGVLTFRVDPYPNGMGPTGSPKAKEADFLHDLAVSDFLNHAEEEFSTALTALNVLLSMSEKEQGDRKKLADYRASLDALDILNEHESQELYKKAQGHRENELEAQCTEWFTKLGVVKKCMRQLLEKLEAHAPGSGVIRAYCRYIRSNELRGIITTMLEDQDDALNQPNAGIEVNADKENEDAPLQGEQDSPQSSANEAHDEKPNQTEPTPGSVTSRLFGDAASPTQSEDAGIFKSDATPSEAPNAVHCADFSAGDNDLDFLESNDSGFGDDKTEETRDDAPLPDAIDDASSTLATEDQLDPVLDASTTDITMDIQMNDNQNTDESHDHEDNGDNEVELSFATDDEVPNGSSEPVEAYDEESHEPTTFAEGEDDVSGLSTSVEVVPTQNEDYDWLGSSNELGSETNEADAFEQDMAAVSEDETDVQDDQAEASQDYDWSNTEAYDATMEEGAETTAEIYDGEAYETEETTENAEVGETSDNTGDDVAATEEPTQPFEVGEGVDADDEEAETFGDWEKGFDPNSNHYFWFNHSTGESAWTPPEGWPYEVDEPFSAEDEGNAGEDQQEQAYEEGTAEEQEYDEAGAEAQEFDEGTTVQEGQYYEEGAENQAYEEATTEEQYYEEGPAEGQYYEEGDAEDQETAAEEQQYEETAVEEQQYEEPAADGQWYDETAVEGDENAAETPSYEQPVEQAGEESPRRSEVSDFEFDDSDLPGF